MSSPPPYFRHDVEAISHPFIAQAAVTERGPLPLHRPVVYSIPRALQGFFDGSSLRREEDVIGKCDIIRDTYALGLPAFPMRYGRKGEMCKKCELE